MSFERGLNRDDSPLYINFTNEDGDLIVSIHKEHEEVIIYEQFREEPRAIWRPESGWTR